VNADRRYKPILKAKTDAAIVHDCQHLEVSFNQTNTIADIYADRRFHKQARELD
jgi:hypothetical protein